MTSPGTVFTLVLLVSAAGGATGIFQAHARVETDPGVVANGRLSSLAGALLLSPA